MIHRLLLALTITALLPACVSQAPQVRGAQYYDELCSVCHGTSARGDGPLAADLGAPPADLTLLSQRNDGVFPKEDVMAQIYGYPGRYLIGGMPEFGPVLEGPMVDYTTLSGARIETPQALIDIAAFLDSKQR